LVQVTRDDRRQRAIIHIYLDLGRKSFSNIERNLDAPVRKSNTRKHPKECCFENRGAKSIKLVPAGCSNVPPGKPRQPIIEGNEEVGPQHLGIQAADETLDLVVVEGVRIGQATRPTVRPCCFQK